jgi:hypothetical protein
MVKSARRILVAALLLWPAVLTRSAAAADTPAIEKARALFKRYVDFEHAFDPAVADLYADDALIKNKRTYPDGQVRDRSIPAPHYKALLRTAMPLAKSAGDRSTYSDCKYAEAGDRVRITCARFSERKKYTSPITLLVGPGTNGDWLIFEELSESQP